MKTPIDINDKQALIEAMNAMKPGDFIEVQGNASKITIGCPSLEADPPPLDPSERHPMGTPGSWLD